MTLADGFNGQETPLRHSLAWDLDFTEPKLTFYSLKMKSRVPQEVPGVRIYGSRIELKLQSIALGFELE